MAYQEIVKCGKCGAPIRYIRMKRSGKWMPVNARPVEVIPCIGMDKGGHTFVTLDGEAFRARKKKEESLFYDGVDIIGAFESHFATCPAADEYRRKKK
ncbi:MAG: hypothetical protein IJ601_02325 [Acidaminococcaceae bacterium]|nr:hypothetical protein [Acidaminococcaceae bacterium]